MSDKQLLIPKAYEARSVEDAIYASWEESGFFTPENLPNLLECTQTYCIILPPPNVTGTLHMGHAVMLAIEDAMIRYARLKGKRTLWIPGTDHAAIATQTKVEGILFKESGKTRHDLGREAFLERVVSFAQESHDTIVNQMKKMGASVDWSREAYTLDEPRHLAVNTAFKKMYDDGLIYRGYRVINWDPIGQTTVSDDELVYQEGTTILYTFRYAKDFPIPISTTRLETKVGDTAVAVHPKDARYKKYIGEEFDVNFAGSKLHIRVVGDSAVDPEFGTGALGVTPAHSVIDAEIAERHKLEMVQVIDETAHMLNKAGELVSGKTTIEAREAIAVWLQKEGLLEGEEEITQNLSTAERSGGVIEPLPKMQWFINVNHEFAFVASKRLPISKLKDGQMVSLKTLMQHVVKEGDVKIVPDRFNKTYFHWIDNLRDWNISRQIWFGHQIPVWYKDEQITVGEKPSTDGWEQDADTLDTWFSSGLWTFSTLGWPNENAEDLNLYHPTSVLETGYDILFFWVARMILMSSYLLGEVPFEKVYLHGLVRDEQGRKMSKSLDNIINPLDMIEKYGADATRLSLLVGSTPGNDTKLSEDKIAAYRNFTNKLWNISRFVFMSVDNIQSIDEIKPVTLADKWILGRLSEVIKNATKYYDKYEFSMLGELLRDFTWNEFADWYLEIAKGQKNENTDKILLYVLERLLILWHPFMPFVTEEIYKQFEKGMIMVTDWPLSAHTLKKSDKILFETMQGVIGAIRNVRAQYKIAPKQKMQAVITDKRLTPMSEIIERLARLDKLVIDPDAIKPDDTASAVVDGFQVYIPLAGLVDLNKEKERIHLALKESQEYAKRLTSKLENGDYITNAPKEIVDSTREELEKTQERVKILEEEYASLA